MKVTVFGAGYVGLVSAACLSDMGNSVLCADVDDARVARLQAGEVPIHEPGLAELLRRNVAAGRLRFTTDAAQAVAHGTIVFIAVGTPPAEDGSADVGHVLDVARGIGTHMQDYKVVVNKSTVPVGTAQRVREALVEGLRARQALVPFAVVSNPEFLKEGAAIDDFMHPDRVLIGSDDEQATLLMRALYAPFLRNRDRIMLMDVRSAELTKYVANAMLATRISFMNEMAALAERVGADIEQVRLGIGSDPRIGTHFLYAGCGWGGSCFPKDVRALAHMGQGSGVDMGILRAVQEVNEHQKRLLGRRLVERFGTDLRGHAFAVWGLAFKPETDDLREAPSLVLIEELLARGATVRAFDPEGMAEAAHLLPDVQMTDSAYAAAQGADAVVIVTEWDPFRALDLDRLKLLMSQPVLVDLRNIYRPEDMAARGFQYSGIGRG